MILVTTATTVLTNKINAVMVTRIWKRLFFLSLSVIVFSCKKSDDSAVNTSIPAGFKLSYGDSVFYLQNQSSDYVVNPTQNLTGEYIGFPEGIEIDSKTGAINVSKSETGLRYRITFIPAGATDSFYTTVVISGVNYLDGFYRLNTADSILRPVYNANNNAGIPGLNNGSIFDDGSGCNNAGCNVNVSVGTINLAQTVRNGVFGAVPSNNARQEFQMNYRINDQSDEALNTLKVKLYYFDSIDDVTQEVYDIISSRDGTLLGFNPLFPASQIEVNSIHPAGVSKPAKPRPPCIFILAK
jgi:hypothetical protein